MRKKSKYGKNQRNFQKAVKIKNQEGQTRTTNFISLISRKTETNFQNVKNNAKKI